MKVLIGMVTFGNLLFSKLTINSIKETTKFPVDFFVIVGKPGDTETISWLQAEKIPYRTHSTNMGFSYSLNDIYDYAWKEFDYDAVIIVGNDIVVYPNCIDALINLAENSTYDVISASQYDIRDLITQYPATKKYFEGSNLIYKGEGKPWEYFTDYDKETTIANMQLFDIQNCCLYKRNFFDVIGYADVNFYPAYYTDNDVARRIVNSKLNCCSLTNARFFHFWSRTIHQETGGSNNHYFENNRKYYIKKWGGDFGYEKWELPFAGRPLKIDIREHELEDINWWKSH